MELELAIELDEATLDEIADEYLGRELLDGFLLLDDESALLEELINSTVFEK